jgi:hypothetical protein
MMDLCWEDRNFAENLAKIGTALPWEQFSISITAKAGVYDTGIIVELNIRGMETIRIVIRVKCIYLLIS